MAFAGCFGMKIDLGCVRRTTPLIDTELLYSETPSRIIIEVCPENAAAIEDLFQSDAQYIGNSIKDGQLVIQGQNGQTLIDQDIQNLKIAWKEPLDI